MYFYPNVYRYNISSNKALHSSTDMNATASIGLWRFKLISILLFLHPLKCSFRRNAIVALPITIAVALLLVVFEFSCLNGDSGILFPRIAPLSFRFSMFSVHRRGALHLRTLLPLLPILTAAYAKYSETVFCKFFLIVIDTRTITHSHKFAQTLAFLGAQQATLVYSPYSFGLIFFFFDGIVPWWCLYCTSHRCSSYSCLL